jgi:hypothetical protein
MKKRLTLGADPEFELILGGQVVSASGILHRDIHLPWGEIGVDGSGRPLELRPLPSETARGLVMNVGRLLVAVPALTGGVPSTACEVYAVGGHIHLGFELIPGQLVVSAIEDALGDIFYGLNSRTRLDEGYGKRGDWRSQNWGVEYRTPPSAIWSHPMVALTFVGAIKWVVQGLIRGEDPLKSPALVKVRAAAKNAAAFVKGYNGRLHWGAWREFAGDIHVSRYLGVRVYLESGDRDPEFASDMEAMCARLGVSFIRVVPLSRARGDYISNVPGYWNVLGDFPPFTPGGALCLSWRFRTDAEFRKEELPKLEAAMAAVLRGGESNPDGGRLVRASVPFRAKNPVTEVVEEPEPPAPPAPPRYTCRRCGSEVQDSNMRLHDTGVYCPDCYRDLRMCEGCGRIVFWGPELAISGSGLPYCVDCYQAHFTRCAECGRETPLESAQQGDGGAFYCGRCYTRCGRCGNRTLRDRSVVFRGNDYCWSCFREIAARQDEPDVPVEV